MPNPMKVTFLKDKNILRGETDFTTREAQVGQTYEPLSHEGGKSRPSTVKLEEVLDDQTVVVSNVGGSQPGKRRAMEAQLFLTEYAPITEDRRSPAHIMGAGKGPKGARAVSETLESLLQETRTANQLARETNELLRRLLVAWGAHEDQASKKAG